MSRFSKNKKSFKIAAIYTRVSTETQLEGNGLEIQMKACEEKCRERGLQIYNTYVESAVSGTKEVYEREQFKRLLEDANNKKFDVIVFYCYDRLARSLRIMLNLIHDMDSKGIGFISCQDDIDTTTDVGIMNYQLKGLFAEQEHRTIVRRLKEGRNRAVINKGYGGGKLPYGYVMIDKEISIDSNKVEIIKYIFTMRDNKISKNATANKLNEGEIPSPRGKKWSHKSIGCIIDHEDKYRGCIMNNNVKGICWPKIL